MAVVQEFRQKFYIVNKNLIRWYPGHMDKGMKQIKQQLKSVDCIVEVHDARIPFSGRNPLFKQNVYGVKPHILVLNKVDLLNPHLKSKIQERLKNEGYSKVLFTNCQDGKGYSVKSVVPLACDVIKSSERYNRSEEGSYCMMVIGVPNVGKSSLINSLRNFNLRKGKASPVGAIAGITRSMMTRVKVSADPPLYLLDTPGILTPHVPDVDVGMKLSLCSCFVDHLIGVENIADYLLYWMNKEKNFRYVDLLGLKEPCDNISLVLIQGAFHLNQMKKIKNYDGSYVNKPNTQTVAELLIKTFRTGGFGKVCLDNDFLK